MVSQRLVWEARGLRTGLEDAQDQVAGLVMLGGDAAAGVHSKGSLEGSQNLGTKVGNGGQEG